MAYKATVDGRTIIIDTTREGDLEDIASLRAAIDSKCGMLVIDKIVVGGPSGEPIDVENVDDETLEALLLEREAEAASEFAASVVGAQETGEIADWPIEKVAAAGKDIWITTETAPVGVEIAERIEVISAEVVYGMNFFKDLFASVRDFIGGRSKTTQDALRKARRICLEELRREALLVEADAVVAVRLDYSSIGSQNKGLPQL